MPPHARRVLFVDDSEENRTVASLGLSRFSVECFASGEEALEQVKRGDVAVVVTDQRMPGMTGLQLLERVRRLSPSTTRLLVTAHEDEEPRSHLDGCVQGYFLKPYENAEIEAAIAQGIPAVIDLDELTDRVHAAARTTLADLDHVLEEDERRRQEVAALSAPRQQLVAGI